MRNTLVWKGPNISMFELETVSQSFIPQVQIGLSSAQYRRTELVLNRSNSSVPP
jgi:hypothetical protein